MSSGTSPRGGKRPGKPIFVRLQDQRLRELLERQMEREGVTAAAIVEAALGAFYDPDSAMKFEEVIARRLNQIERQLQDMIERHEISTEFMATFVKDWLVNAPRLPADLPEIELRAIQAAAMKKYLEHIDNSLKALHNKRGLYQRAMSMMTAPHDSTDKPTE